MKEVTVSVIIPYYDKWLRFKYMLESVRLQDYPKENFEIIVIDDGSKIPLIEFLDEKRLHFSNQMTICRTTNGGRSAARNSGARLAGGQILLFIDDDIILPPDFVSRHVRTHAAHSRDLFVHSRMYDLPEFTMILDPETGESFPFLPQLRNRKPYAEEHLLTFDRVFGKWSEFISSRGRMSRLERFIEATLHNPELRSFHWVGCVGGNMSVPKDLFMKAGAYDETFRVWGGEDFELGYRLIRQGTSAFYESGNPSYHLTHAHSHAITELLESKQYFIDKHADTSIGLLYDFLEKKIDDCQLFELWKKVLDYGEDRSEAGIKGGRTVQD